MIGQDGKAYGNCDKFDKLRNDFWVGLGCVGLMKKGIWELWKGKPS